MKSPRPRSGLTLLELMVVLALLIILAAVTLPSFAGLKGNSDQRAAADTVRGRIADARGLAMDQGVPYRLAVHQDGSKIRLAPDLPNFSELPVSDEATGSATAIETTLDKVTINVAADSEGGAPVADPAGWITLATFLPSGICRESGVTVEVHETDFPPIRIQLRGVTGTSRVLQPEAKSGGMP